MDRELRTRLRTPLRTMCVLLGLLAINVTLGATWTHGFAWIIQALVAMSMVAIVLTVSMEVRHDPPLMRLVAALGFFWVAILFTFVMLDYTTR